MKSLIIFIIIILFIPAALWYGALKEMTPIFAAIIAMAVISVLYFIVYSILVSVHNRKSKCLLSDKNPDIVSAKNQDEMNRQTNESNRLDALRKKNEQYAPKIKACEAEIRKLERQQSQLEAELDAIDGLSKKDKHPETIDFLIERIESRRADSLKEALQQYDAAGRPKSTYSGRDWDLSKGISDDDLPKLEDDLCELMDFIAHTNNYDDRKRNWFARLCLLFTQSVVSSDAAVKENYGACINTTDNSKSWIVHTAGVLSSCVGTDVFTSILSGRVVHTSRETFAKCKPDRPLTAKEKKFMENATIVLDSLTYVLYDDFQKFQKKV